MPNPDFVEPDNIFSEDYLHDSLFDEEDEEVGVDFHEIDLANERGKNVHEETEIADIPRHNQTHSQSRNKQLIKSKRKIPRKMVAKGITRIIIEKGDKLLVLLP
jgi:hypothetical protein